MTSVQGAPGTKGLYTWRALLMDLRRVVRGAPDLFSAVRDPRISRAFAEKIMLAVTAVNDCRYCSYGHARMALASGVSQREIDLLLSGDVGHTSPQEAPALLFAQHYAESGGCPDAEAYERLVDAYGERGARHVLAYIRMITVGNLLGNTLDALLGRLRGRPVAGSSLRQEVLVLALFALSSPVVVVGMLIRGVAGLARQAVQRPQRHPAARKGEWV